MTRKLLMALFLMLPFSTMASAQDFDWRTVLSQSIKVQMKIDLAFEVSKERVVPLHFTMGVPMSPDKLITRTHFPKEQGNLGEMVFQSPDNTLLEFVTISLGTIGGDTTEERQQRLFSLIETQVYPSLAPPETAQVLGGRRAVVAGQPAVEFVALFDSPSQGPIAARITGVISPNDTDLVIMVQQTMRNPMDLSGPDELAKTFAGTMLSSLTFQAYRDESGTLVDF